MFFNLSNFFTLKIKEMATYFNIIGEDILYLILSDLNLDDFNSIIEVLKLGEDFIPDYLRLISLRYGSYSVKYLMYLIHINISL